MLTHLAPHQGEHRMDLCARARHGELLVMGFEG